MTNFAAKELFLKRGRVLAPPQAQALGQMIGEAYEVSGAKIRFRLSGNLVEIPEIGLIHGAFLLAGNTMYMRFGENLPTNSPPS